MLRRGAGGRAGATRPHASRGEELDQLRRVERRPARGNGAVRLATAEEEGFGTRGTVTPLQAELDHQLLAPLCAEIRRRMSAQGSEGCIITAQSRILKGPFATATCDAGRCRSWVTGGYGGTYALGPLVPIHQTLPVLIATSEECQERSFVVPPIASEANMMRSCRPRRICRLRISNAVRAQARELTAAFNRQPQNRAAAPRRKVGWILNTI